MATPAFNFNALMPLVQSLQNRYGQAMDIQTQRMSDAGSNDRIAFRDQRERKKLDLAERKQDMELRRKAYSSAEASKALALREKKASEAYARNDERSRLNASINRTRAQVGSVPSATGFDPSGTIADYYEYGAGNPQGRGGGGSAGGGAVTDAPPASAGGFDPVQIRNCYQNPAGPGCAGLLQMYETHLVASRGRG